MSVEELRERIKELQCLYDVSHLMADSQSTVEQILERVVERIVPAWKYPEHAVAELILVDIHLQSQPIDMETVSLKMPIEVEGERVGVLKVHYPSATHDESSFLEFESLLLQKLAKEIALLWEKHLREKRESVLRRTAERNDRLAILGELTAGIAHELNTPLGSIMGYSELIASSNDPVQMKRDANRILQSAMHARDVVKNLMFFSCEMPQNRLDIHVGEAIESSLKLLEPTLKKAQIELQTDIESGIIARVDSLQLAQVVFNLVINAIHASPADSTIAVSLQRDGEVFRLMVEDKGAGIPENVRDQIFEPFFTTRPLGEGTGLGLSVVHGIIKSHGGHIRFATTEGEGTTFVVSIPIQ